MFALPLPELLLRCAVAFAFLYPPIAALFDPLSWISYFPGFVVALVGSEQVLLLHAFGVIEVAIAGWILFGRRIFWPALAASALLIAIVLTNLNQFDILFRDVSIALAALSLVALHHRHE